MILYTIAKKKILAGGYVMFVKNLYYFYRNGALVLDTPLLQQLEKIYISL